MALMLKHGLSSSQMNGFRKRLARHAVPNSLSTVQRCIDGQLPNMSRSGDGSGVRITDTRTTCGIVLEYMWHVIFGKPAYWCPSARDCYCGTWNQCDLECDDEVGWCEGRIWLRDPPNVMPVSNS
jgi:hypothetical protein